MSSTTSKQCATSGFTRVGFPVGEVRQGNEGTSGSEEEIIKSSPQTLDPVPVLVDSLKASLATRGAVYEFNRGTWEDSCRLLIDAGYSPEDLAAAIEFTQTDSFWSPKVTSFPLLRRHIGTVMERVRETQNRKIGSAPRFERKRSAAEWFQIYRQILDPEEWPDEDLKRLAHDIEEGQA